MLIFIKLRTALPPNQLLNFPCHVGPLANMILVLLSFASLIKVKQLLTRHPDFVHACCTSHLFIVMKAVYLFERMVALHAIHFFHWIEC